MADNELSEAITMIQGFVMPILKEEFKMAKKLATLEPIKIGLKKAEEISKIVGLDFNSLKNGTVIQLVVQKVWVELNDAEKYSMMLDEVRKAGNLSEAKKRFSEVKGVKEASTYEELAAIIWAARMSRDSKRSGEVKNFPSSKKGTPCGCIKLIKGHEVKIVGTIILDK